MIGLEINGKFLNLTAGANIRFEKTFFTLEAGLFQGDYSFPFDLPADEHNLSIFGILTEVSNKNKILKYECFIYLFDIPWQKATLRILSNTRRTIKVNIAAGIKSLNTAGKSLKEIDYGPDVYLGRLSDEIAARATNLAQEGTFDIHGFTFVPHINEGFYGDSNPDFKGVLNMMNPNNGLMYHNTTSTGNKYALVPFLYLHFILQKIFDAEGLRPIGTFWEHPEMRTLLVYNNKALDSFNEIGGTRVQSLTYQSNTQNDFYYGPTWPFRAINDKFVKGPTGTYDEPSAWSNTNHRYEITEQGLYEFEFEGHAWRWLDFHMAIFVNGNPIIASSYDDNQINAQNIHVYGAKFSFIANSSDIGKFVQLGFVNYALPPGGPPGTPVTVCYIDSGSTLTVKQSNVNQLNTFSRFIKYSNHVKDIPVEEFLLALKKLGVEFNFDFINKTASIDFVTTVFENNKMVDWTSKASNEYEVSYDSYKRGYKVSYDFGSTDKLNENNFLGLQIADATGQVNTISELPSINNEGTIFYVKNLNQFWKRSYDAFATPQWFWQKHSDHYYENVFEGGENEVKLTFAPMLMGMGKNIPPSPDADKETALMPASNCLGNSDLFGSGSDDFDLRLMFFRGQNVVGGAPYNKGGNYLFANTTTIGLNANIVGNFDFTLHLSSGFWQRFLVETYQRLATGEIYEQDFVLDEVDILNINKAVKVCVDGNVFLNKSVSIIVSDHLKTCRVKIMKI